MPIQEKIENDFIQARKVKNELGISALRMFRAAIKNAEIAKRPDALSDTDIIKVLRGEIKKRKEAAKDYKKGGRQDLADKELEEVRIIEKYLPVEIGDTALKEIILKTVKELGAQSPRDFGKTMGAVMKKVGGQADGGRVSKVLKEVLSQGQ